MNNSLEDKKNLIEKLLIEDVKVATGCTEPVTIALASLYACRELHDEHVKKLIIKPSINLFKNAMEVGIPGTDYNHGVPLAAALGAVLAKENKSKITPDLNILSNINQDHFITAKSLVNSGKVSIEIDYTSHGLSVEALVIGENGTNVLSLIKDSHDNLFRLEKNGKTLLPDIKSNSANYPIEKEEKKIDQNIDANQSIRSNQNPLIDLRHELALIPYKEIVSLLPQLSLECKKHLLEGMNVNWKMLESAITSSRGILKIGPAYRELFKECEKNIKDASQDLVENTFLNQAITAVAAAVDARMSGFDMPVMTSAGSGNQGLTITLPLKTYFELYQIPETILCEALALGHLTTSITKAHTGTLSAMCGCVVCAGIGLAAALTYLMFYRRNNHAVLSDKDLDEMMDELSSAIDIMVASVTGIICDGAKVGCSVKAVCSVTSAYHAAILASSKIKIPATNGVLGHNIDVTLRNLGKIASPGMISTDDQILSIMINKPNGNNKITSENE
ncbi:MAG: serine dehydratase subunit alpha family protein [Oligoflexia bacterium]|nr:serine dehydratase subunit alpha family protein [Oligoflexia bacterium]